MQTDYFSKTFILEGYVIDEVEHEIGAVLLHCHVRRRGMWWNGEYSKKIAETRVRRISHMMVENVQVVLVVKQRRFVFKGTRLWEAMPGIEKYKQTSNTFRLHTLRALQRDNYSGSGHARQRSGMFPMKLLDDLPLRAEWKPGITRIGLDGKAVKGREMVHHIADLNAGKSVMVIPSRGRDALKKNFWRLRKRTGKQYWRYVPTWIPCISTWRKKFFHWQKW